MEEAKSSMRVRIELVDVITARIFSFSVARLPETMAA